MIESEGGPRIAGVMFDPPALQVHIYTADSIEALTRPIDVLTGGVVVPGFKCRLSRIFRAS